MILQRGKRYRIIHRAPGQGFDRESIMDYLGPGQTRFNDHELEFSARPVAGTQAFPKTWILSAEEVPASTPITLNRRAK